MPDYPELDVPPPSPYNEDDFRRWEEALRQLAVADHLIKRCERCNIPVSAARTDCDALCTFFQSLMKEFRGPNAPVPGVVS
jgi:hypothetical protein